jgi:hypothetical protein
MPSFQDFYYGSSFTKAIIIRVSTGAVIVKTVITKAKSPSKTKGLP